MCYYNKPPKTIQEQIQLLINKKLNISDVQFAEQILSNISYTRLSNYFSPFYVPNTEIFKSGTQFEIITSLYNFDKKIRLVALEALEQIEVAVRTVISNLMSIRYSDPYWYKNQTLFLNHNEHNDFISRCKQHAGKNLFYDPTTNSVITSAKNKHPELFNFYTKYVNEDLPPSWLLAEALTMGCWSKLFANLKENQAKRKIADVFGFAWRDFISWLTAITLYRNTIAHHQRFWNEPYPALNLPNINKYLIDCGSINRIYLNYLVIFRFLQYITKHSDWKNHLLTVLDTCPLDIHMYMNFPINWENLDFWTKLD